MNPIGLKSALNRLAAMPGQKRLAGALAAVAVVMAISACGSSSSNSTIPQGNANELMADLNGVQSAVDARQCNLATQRARDFLDAVDKLPDTVTPDDKAKLLKAGQNLESQAQDPQQCKPEAPTGTSGLTGTHPTTTNETTTSTPVVPTTTETTTTSTSTTSTPPEPSGNGGGGETSGGGSSSTGGGGETGGGGGETSGGGGEVGGGSGGTGGTGTGGTGGGGTG
jgi:hypothetical protein